jgi:hypothetical protein
MPYTLGQAARATGKSKPTILRSINLGRISATKGPLGTWQIEPVELHRVYPPLVTAEQQERSDPERHETLSNANVLEAQNQLLLERLEEKDRVIEDLRHDRDHWREESDSWRKQAQSLLTDQRVPHSEATEEAQPRASGRRWWKWFMLV